MCYPDREYYITLLFQLFEEFEARIHSSEPSVEAPTVRSFSV